MVCVLEDVIKRYGGRLVLRQGEKRVVFRGFLQHSRSKSMQNMERVYGPLGEIPGGRFLLMAPMSVAISVGDIIEQKDRTFTVQRIETATINDREVYRWGLCTERGVDP